MAWLVVVTVLLDAASTILGLGLGLPESGPVASRLLPLMGPVYFAVELGVVYGLNRLLRYTGHEGHRAATVASLGPWLAGWHNMGLLVRLGVPGGVL